MRRPLLVLAVWLAAGSLAAAAVPDAPPLPPSTHHLKSAAELTALIGQAKQEILYVTAGVPSRAISDTLAAVTVPTYVLLPSRPLTATERSLLGKPHIRVRLSDRFSGTGGFLLLDRRTIVLGPLLAGAADSGQETTVAAWIPDAEDLVRFFRALWDVAKPPQKG